MLKILHIVSDDKFIDRQIERYFTAGIDNDIVYLCNKFTYKGVYIDIIKWVKPLSEELNDLIKEVKKFDFVIIYYMDYDKAYFVNRIDKAKLIIWHFFGGEIYHADKFKFDYFSPETKKILKVHPDFVRKTKNRLKDIREAFKKLVIGKRGYSGEIFQAIKRSNYFLWYNENEYQLIKQKLPFLPEFLPLPLTNKIPELRLDEQKENKILVGNSIAASNNHYEVLLALQRADFKGLVLLPFSYGGKYDYSRYLLPLQALVKKLSYPVEFLEKFIPYTDYIKMIGVCSAAVFNSYRQMALGNIFILLTNGVKVYLSERNPSFNWFKDKGFHIFSIEQHLEDDLQNDNIVLPKEYGVINRQRFSDLINPVHKEEFLKRLVNIYRAKIID